MHQNETVGYHAQLALEHRSMASYAASAAVQHYHAIMADHHAAKADPARRGTQGQPANGPR